MTRIQGPDAVTNAIAFARYTNGKFGWGVVDPGHGLVFANSKRPLDAAAAVGPVGHRPVRPAAARQQTPTSCPRLGQRYLLDIQPGYEKDPVRGVYNHGWMIGDEAAISTAVQARIDALLQIVPVDKGSSSQQQDDGDEDHHDRSRRRAARPRRPTKTNDDTK